MLVLALSVGLLGCDDFFSAELTGFLKRQRTVKDGDAIEAGEGIDGARVRVFLDEPKTFDGEGFVAETTTEDNHTLATPLPGFYRVGVAWKTSSAEFGSDGDVRNVWIATQHPDYESRVVAFDAVLSNTINLVPELLLRGLRMEPEVVRGRVAMDGVGIDGVRVSLALDDVDAKFEARTQTIGDRSGEYAFDDVTWDAALGETVAATVAVADPSYIAAGAVGIELTADQAVEVSEPLAVRSSFFAAKLLRGRVVDASGQGVNGVRIVLRPENTQQDGWLSATVTSQQGEQSGVYEFVDLGWFLPTSTGLFDTYDTQKVMLEVEDPEYAQEPAKALAVLIGYGQELYESEDLVVVRRPRSDFTALVQGRCIEPAGMAGVPGIEVTATFSDDDGEHQLVTRTDANGSYSLFAAWRRTETADAAPSGEDEIALEISFARIDRHDTRLVLDPVNYLARSWVHPNYVPDALATVEDFPDGGD